MGGGRGAGGGGKKRAPNERSAGEGAEAPGPNVRGRGPGQPKHGDQGAADDRVRPVGNQAGDQLWVEQRGRGGDPGGAGGGPRNS